MNHFIGWLLFSPLSPMIAMNIFAYTVYPLLVHSTFEFAIEPETAVRMVEKQYDIGNFIEL